MADPFVATTLGALLVGGSIALILSGTLSVQCIVFYKLYPHDLRIRLAMVLAVWFLDLLHSSFIVASLFYYLIEFFGDKDEIDHIPWSIALTVVVTATQTLIAHWFYAQKIFHSSGKNWWITMPIVLLAFGRLLAASVSTYEMLHMKRFSAFTEPYPGWVFTTGLSLSALVDVIITGWLCYFLQSMRKRTNSTLMARLMHTMTIYTLENGLVTCLAATASLICWLTMKQNLIFLGLHFVIGKLYANSLLFSLNTRKELREMRSQDQPAQGGSMWPVLRSGSDHGELSTSPGISGGYVGVISAISPTGFGTGSSYAYPYGVISTGSMEVSLASQTQTGAGYHPAFKVPVSPPARAQHQESGIRVTRTVRRASDDLSVSDVSRDEYTSAAYAGVAGRRNQFGTAAHEQERRQRKRRSRSRGKDDLRAALP